MYVVVMLILMSWAVSSWNPRKFGEPHYVWHHTNGCMSSLLILVSCYHSDYTQIPCMSVSHQTIGYGTQVRSKGTQSRRLHKKEQILLSPPCQLSRQGTERCRA